MPVPPVMVADAVPPMVQPAGTLGVIVTVSELLLLITVTGLEQLHPLASVTVAVYVPAGTAMLGLVMPLLQM